MMMSEEGRVGVGVFNRVEHVEHVEVEDGNGVSCYA